LGEGTRNYLAAQARANGKPDARHPEAQSRQERVLRGEVLYEQHFIKDETMTIGEKIARPSAKLAKTYQSPLRRLKVGEIPNQQPCPLPSSSTLVSQHGPATIYLQPKKARPPGHWLYV